jgi:hypothetical protein
MRHRQLSVVSGSIIVCLFSLLVACGSKAPRPGFVGIPEAVERTPDFTLPLTDQDRQAIIDFMANSGRRPLPWWSRADVDPDVIADLEKEYGGLLHALGEKPPAIEDLSEGGAIAKYFDAPEWVLSVHDARVGKDDDGEYYDLDSERGRALVKGDFVFAFYARRLTPIIVTKDQVPALTPREGTVWVLGNQRGSTYTGLVVFHKHFAISP